MSSGQKLSRKQIAVQVTRLINLEAKNGRLLQRTSESVYQSLLVGDGYAVIFCRKVVAYAECVENEECHVLRSVVSDSKSRGGRHGLIAIVNRLKLCWLRAPEKRVILACSHELVELYERFGFQKRMKNEAPEYIRGGRTDTQWAECDREWMVCSKLSYQQKKEIGTMAKLNVFVKISGDLLENLKVLNWLREMGKIYSLVVCVGGGTQINEAFSQHGYKNNFGLLGRETKTLPERQLARDILEQNQALVQDLFDDNGISGRVIIPVEDIGGVLCHINGDIMLLAAYNGYDKIFVLTEDGKRVTTKKEWLARLSQALRTGEDGDLSKIEVIGF